MTFTDLTHAPLAPVPLAGTKLNDLVQELAHAATEQGIRTPEAWPAFLAGERARYAALVDLFDPQKPLAEALSGELEQKLAAAYPGLIADAERPAVARQVMASILTNRRSDAVATTRKLDDHAWQADMRDAILGGRITPASGPEVLLASKYDEMAQVMLGPDRAKPEAAAHVVFTALGHLAGHRALAETFAPESPGTQRFIAELQARCSDQPPEALAAFGQRWMKLREDRARLTVDANQPTSDMVQGAIAEGEARRLAPHTAATAQEAPPQPTSIIPQPTLTARTTLFGRFGAWLQRQRTEPAAAPQR